jgi:hypothetical protein
MSRFVVAGLKCSEVSEEYPDGVAYWSAFTDVVSALEFVRLEMAHLASECVKPGREWLSDFRPFIGSTIAHSPWERCPSSGHLLYCDTVTMLETFVPFGGVA